MAIATAFLDALAAQRSDLEVDVLDLTTAVLPEVLEPEADIKPVLIAGGTVDAEEVPSWPRITALIDQFLAADVCLVTVPMWNFGVPYHLKHWIDCIVQPGSLFRYDEHRRPVGMVHGKRMVCVTSRGGDYSSDGPMGQFDMQEPYLRAIFGFVGITDIVFVNAQPMDITPDLRAMALSAATAAASELGSSLSWAATEPVGA